MPVPHSNFGYIPDPPDPRDWAYENLRASRALTLVEALDWRQQVPEILDQLSLGSCVGNAVAAAIRLKNVFDGIKNPKLSSRLHFYAGARSYIGTVDWDSGSHLRDAFRFGNAVGYMPEDESDHDYDITKFTELPSPREQRFMHDQKNKLQGQVSYYRIREQGKDRISALKHAMSGAGVVVLGTSTTQEFLDYRSGILHRPSPSVRQTGGHAFYLVGYTEDYVLIANSWNTDWGQDGFGALGWDYIEWDETRDIWVIDKAPYFSHLLEAA